MILSVSGLRITFRAGGREFAAVDGVDFAVARGRTLGILGESGSGKSMLSLSLLRLLPRPGRIAAGQALFEGQDLFSLPEAGLRALRGNRIAMIFQNPMTSLNPVRSVGAQIIEALRAHDAGASPGARRARAIESLEQVRIPHPERHADAYPHQLSGALRQRVMIAMAIACEPALLIADEPTATLDVTAQAAILDLLRDLQARTGMAMILITQDPGLLADLAHDVAVMYAGRIVERCATAALFDDPQHPYTIGLLGGVFAAIEGAAPPPFARPRGCGFHPRCVFADQGCTVDDQRLRELAPQHFAACRRAPVEQIPA